MCNFSFCGPGKTKQRKKNGNEKKNKKKLIIMNLKGHQFHHVVTITYCIKNNDAAMWCPFALPLV